MPPRCPICGRFLRRISALVAYCGTIGMEHGSMSKYDMLDGLGGPLHIPYEPVYCGTPAEVIGVDNCCTNCGWGDEMSLQEFASLHVYASLWNEDTQAPPGTGSGWITVQCQCCYSFFRVDISS